MRRLLCCLLVTVALPAVAGAAPLTVGGHNEVGFTGGAYVDVRFDRDSVIYKPGTTDDASPRWKFAWSRGEGLQTLLLRSFLPIGPEASRVEIEMTFRKGRLSTMGARSSGFAVPAGDYRLWVGSTGDGPTSFALDVPDFTGTRVMQPVETLTATGGPVPELERRRDGTRVFGRSGYLPAPGILVVATDSVGPDETLYAESGACLTFGREVQAVPADFGPGCASDTPYAPDSSQGNTSLMTEIPAGWSSWGTWNRGIVGSSWEQADTALWMTLGAPMTEPVWPPDAAAPATAAPARPKAMKKQRPQKRRAKHRRSRRH